MLLNIRHVYPNNEKLVTFQQNLLELVHGGNTGLTNFRWLLAAVIINLCKIANYLNNFGL